MTTIERLKIKYGVIIRDDSFWNPRLQRISKAYKMYSADGCPWENGLHSLKAVEEECKRYADVLLTIKKTTEKR